MSKTFIAAKPETGKRERAKAANRDAILVAARHVFAELGFEATTVRDIIRGTDLASGTFYNYFKSKEEVFEALARQSVTQFRPRLQDVRKTATSFEDYISGAIRAYFQFLMDSKRTNQADDLHHIPLVGVRVDTPEMQAVFQEIRNDIEDFLARQGAGDVDTEYLTAAAIGVARELGDCMVSRKTGDEQQIIDQVTAFATNMILNGVRDLIKDIKTE